MLESFVKAMEFSMEVASNVSDIVDQHRNSTKPEGVQFPLWHELCANECFDMARALSERHGVKFSKTMILDVLIRVYGLRFKDEFIALNVESSDSARLVKLIQNQTEIQNAPSELVRLTEEMGLYEHQNRPATKVDNDGNKEESTGVKFDQDKPRFDLVPQGPYYKVVELYTHGAKKYGDRNWEKGIVFSRLIAAAQRHLHSFVCGENEDRESGCHHLASVVFYCFAMMEFQIRGKRELDDRQSYVNKSESEVSG